jgi:hypothetical protein
MYSFVSESDYAQTFDVLVCFRVRFCTNLRYARLSQTQTTHKPSMCSFVSESDYAQTFNVLACFRVRLRTNLQCARLFQSQTTHKPSMCSFVSESDYAQTFDVLVCLRVRLRTNLFISELNCLIANIMSFACTTIYKYILISIYFNYSKYNNLLCTTN